MAKTPPKDAFERVTNPDGTPVRDQNNAQMRPAPPRLANKPAPNLAPPGMAGIKRKSPTPTVAPSFSKAPAGLSVDYSKDSSWIEGRVISMPGYTFHAKVFDTPSQYGIEGGTISKLDVRKDDVLVMRYDRGWDTDPKTPEHREALHRIRNGLGDTQQKQVKGFEHKPGKGHGMDR
ncbi:MAG: hypothetical protein HEP70_19340 [Rhodobiaceae bacterium]|jgi:hypothetical protein|nr:hypothetical protein [Rhodobiaceae bacterium]